MKEDSPQLIEHYALFFERHAYQDVKKMVDDFNDYEKFTNFWSDLYNDEIYREISRHKIALANFLAQKSEVKILPDDRTRIVFFFAQCAGKDLSAANTIMQKEFGANFKILPKYETKNIVRPWQDYALRAKEIKNGYNNHAYLSVQNQVSQIMASYRSNRITDTEKLMKINTMAVDILQAIGADPFLTHLSPQFEQVKKKIIDFYRLTGRLELDIAKIENGDISLDNINQYLINTQLTVSTKLYLMKKNVAPNDLVAAEDCLLKMLGRIELETYIDLDETKRLGQPLEKLSSSTQPNQNMH